MLGDGWRRGPLRPAVTRVIYRKRARSGSRRTHASPAAFDTAERLWQWLALSFITVVERRSTVRDIWSAQRQRHHMSSKAARGTKRTCQNNECGSRFYDLNRDPITCPVCQTAYVIASAPLSAAAIAAEEKARKAAKPVEVLQPEGELAPEGAEELADVEAAEEPVAEASDETFLEEEEEEGGDVSGLIGDVAEGEEEV
jgi:uncharacterized protein (TIGR02300 family)